MSVFKTPIPLSLYIHFPWCVKKCPYCDFNSHTLQKSLPEKDYIHALLQDLDKQLPSVWGRKLVSIFMGGGTPSLFSSESLDLLLSELRARFNFPSELEITLEANPGTVEQSKFQEYKNVGITRLSLGIQSFQEEKLKKLGRIHGEKEAHKAIESAFNAGFEDINLDLMFGLPEQSLEDGLYDLSTAISYNTPHLSWYQLTLEPNTVFYRNPPPLPPDENIWTLQQEGEKLLKTAGFQHYEVSAHAKPYHQCQHNLNYWEFGDYLGIGAGAHSKITDVQAGKIYRTFNKKQPTIYLQSNNDFIREKWEVTEKDLPFEFMLNALRLSKSPSFQLFSERTGLSKEAILPTLEKAKEKGLLTFDSFGITLTQKGREFLNEVTLLFM